MSNPIQPLPSEKRGPDWQIDICGPGLRMDMPVLYSIYSGTDAAKGVEFTYTENDYVGIEEFKIELPKQPGKAHRLIPSGSVVRFRLNNMDESGLASPIEEVEETEYKQTLSGTGYGPMLEKYVVESSPRMKAILEDSWGKEIDTFWYDLFIAIDNLRQSWRRKLYDSMGSNLVFINNLINNPTFPFERLRGFTNNPYSNENDWHRKFDWFPGVYWRDRITSAGLGDHYPSLKSGNALSLIKEALEFMNYNTSNRVVVQPSKWRMWIDGYRRIRLQEYFYYTDSKELVQGHDFFEADCETNEDSIVNSIEIYETISYTDRNNNTTKKLVPAWIDGDLKQDFPQRDLLSIGKYGERRKRINSDRYLGGRGAAPVIGPPMAKRIFKRLSEPQEVCKIETGSKVLSSWGYCNLLFKNTLKTKTLWQLFGGQRDTTEVGTKDKEFQLLTKTDPKTLGMDSNNFDVAPNDLNIFSVGLRITPSVELVNIPPFKPTYSKSYIDFHRKSAPGSRLSSEHKTTICTLTYTTPETIWGATKFTTKVARVSPGTKSRFFVVIEDTRRDFISREITLPLYKWLDIEITIRGVYTVEDLSVNKTKSVAENLELNKPPQEKARVDVLRNPDAHTSRGILNVKRVWFLVQGAEEFRAYISWGIVEGVFPSRKRLPLLNRTIKAEKGIKVKSTFGDASDVDTIINRIKSNTENTEIVRVLNSQ